MKTFIGTKIIKAEAMTRLEYTVYRGWELPDEEVHLAHENGMLVEYNDSAHPNMDGHAGYVSWSPMSVFEDSYEPTDGMSFGLAIEAMRKGEKVARAGWNGKDMFIFWVNGSQFKVNRAPLLGIYPEGTVINYHSHIDMKTADNQVVPWLASQTDMAALDWTIVQQFALNLIQ